MKQLTLNKSKMKPDFEIKNQYQIRELIRTEQFGTAHCTVLSNGLSETYKNDFDEVWYIIEGNGEIWWDIDGGIVNSISENDCIHIPKNTPYQFKNLRKNTLSFFIVTSPPFKEDMHHVLEKSRW
jgi:mannose-6-phosphate isomerase-like protein (cupin superfamily)